MKVKELIEILKTHPEDYEVRFLDQDCGYALEINDEDIIRDDPCERVLIG